MNEITSIIERLEKQQESIAKAIAALKEVESATDTSSKSAGPTKRGMSAAGRKRISDATKARWAAKRAGESEAQPKKRQISAAGRKRMAAAQRKRWAAIKSQAEAPKKAAKKKARKKSAKKAGRKGKTTSPGQAKAVAATATE